MLTKLFHAPQAIQTQAPTKLSTLSEPGKVIFEIDANLRPHLQRGDTPSTVPLSESESWSNATDQNQSNISAHDSASSGKTTDYKPKRLQWFLYRRLNGKDADGNRLSTDMRHKPLTLSTFQKVEMGMVGSPNKVIKGLNAGLSQFHKISEQIHETFTEKWDGVGTMGMSNSSNICDFGKESVATARFARKTIIRSLEDATGVLDTKDHPAMPKFIQRHYSKDDLKLYVAAYKPRTRRSLGETALIIEVGKERIPLIYRPSEGKARPNTGLHTAQAAKWTEAPDFLMKNNLRQIEVDATPDAISRLLHQIKATISESGGDQANLTSLMERIGIADDPSAIDTPRTLNDLTNPQPLAHFHATQSNSTHGVIHALENANIARPGPLQASHFKHTMAQPRQIWNQLTDDCPTFNGLSQLQTPTRGEWVKTLFKMISMESSSELTEAASDLLDAMMQFRKDLETFKGTSENIEKSDYDYLMDQFGAMPLPETAKKALVKSLVNYGPTDWIKKLPAPYKLKALAESFAQFTDQSIDITRDALSQATCQGRTIPRGDRMMPRQEELVTNEPAQVKLKIITHPPRTNTSQGQSGLGIEVNGKLVHAVGFRPTHCKARRWTGKLIGRDISLENMRSLLRKPNLKVIDLDLNDAQIKAIITDLNQQHANLTGSEELFLPQVGHIKSGDIQEPQKHAMQFGRAGGQTSGNDVDHIRYTLERANQTIPPAESAPIETPDLICKKGTTSRQLAKVIQDTQAPLYNMYFPERLTLVEKFRMAGQFSTMTEKLETLLNAVLKGANDCIDYTEDLMVNLPGTMEAEIKGATSTAATPHHAPHGTGPQSNVEKNERHSWSYFAGNALRGLFGQQDSGQNSYLEGGKHLINGVIKTPKALVDLDQHLTDLLDSMDKVKDIAKDTWKPIIEPDQTPSTWRTNLPVFLRRLVH